jgi:soluble lytic murein transglycosylase
MLSQSDTSLYREAFAAAGRGKWRTADRLAARARQPLPAKVLVWKEMTTPGARQTFDQITRFMDANPHWPGRKKLRRRAEEAITPGSKADQLLAWFASHPPLTTDGKTAMGRALMATGSTAAAKAMLRRAWIEGSFGRRQESRFLRRYRKLLTRDDHMARLDRLLWNGRHRQALRMMRRVDKSYRPVVIARIRLRKYRGGVDRAIRRVPEALRRDPGFLYERLRWRRRKGRDDDAMEILNHPPGDMVRPDLWWRERGIMARRLLVRGRVSDAYRVARQNGLTSGAKFASAEWLAGWIALRFLREDKDALAHFQNLFEKVRTPISRARAAYWAGRAAESLGRPAETARWYGLAAQFGATYYGQLANLRQTETARRPLPADPRPTGTEIAAFNRNELVRVVRMLDELDQDDEIGIFVTHLAKLAKTPGEMVLAGRLALALGRIDLGVRVGRQAYRAGTPLMQLAYPVIDVPDGGPEPALLLAVARQESNFSATALSSAGARGLMQLMPATARAVSRTIKTRYSRSRLITDPAYNIRLGRAYLGGLIERYGGSYVLAIAAYNAGPGAVKGWFRKTGDPRNGDVDMIDWIELIPYPETRNYVQRVLENLQVYRRRLDGTRIAFSLHQDLNR